MDESNSYKVADISLADAGERRVDWARARMPVLARLKAEAEKNQPLKGMVVAGCLHVTKETAVLIETIEAAGAKVSWSGCNPLSTQDDVAAWLAREGYSIYAWHGQSVEDFYWCIDRTLDFKPTLTLDDGADLIVRVHGEKSEYAETVIGGTATLILCLHIIFDKKNISLPNFIMKKKINLAKIRNSRHYERADYAMMRIETLFKKRYTFIFHNVFLKIIAEIPNIVKS